jgi:hypothetical protein
MESSPSGQQVDVLKRKRSAANLESAEQTLQHPAPLLVCWADVLVIVQPAPLFDGFPHRADIAVPIASLFLCHRVQPSEDSAFQPDSAPDHSPGRSTIA